MENLFLSAASEKEQVKKRQNAFLNRLISDLKSAYVNIKHIKSRHYNSGSTWEFGIFNNENVTHEFKINQNNEIIFKSRYMLIHNREFEKIENLALKYPNSNFNGIEFSLVVEGITEDNIKDFISDIVFILELDGFTLKY